MQSDELTQRVDRQETRPYLTAVGGRGFHKIWPLVHPRLVPEDNEQSILLFEARPSQRLLQRPRRLFAQEHDRRLRRRLAHERLAIQDAANHGQQPRRLARRLDLAVELSQPTLGDPRTRNPRHTGQCLLCHLAGRMNRQKCLFLFPVLKVGTGTDIILTYPRGLQGGAPDRGIGQIVGRPGRLGAIGQPVANRTLGRPPGSWLSPFA